MKTRLEPLTMTSVIVSSRIRCSMGLRNGRISSNPFIRSLQASSPKYDSVGSEGLALLPTASISSGGLQDADVTIRTALVKRFLLWISRPDHLPAEWVVIRKMLNVNLLVKHHWPLSKWSNSFCEYINTHSTIWCDLVVVSAP